MYCIEHVSSKAITQIDDNNEGVGFHFISKVTDKWFNTRWRNIIVVLIVIDVYWGLTCDDEKLMILITIVKPQENR